MIHFKEEKKPGLLGISTVFTMAQENPSSDPFQIIADKGGVRFLGTSERINDMVDLQELAKIFDKAWKAHIIHKPKITSITGH